MDLPASQRIQHTVPALMELHFAGSARRKFLVLCIILRSLPPSLLFIYMQRFASSTLVVFAPCLDSVARSLGLLL